MRQAGFSMKLATLPAELILHVVQFLRWEADINFLSQVNRHLYSIVNNVLYKQHTPTGYHSHAIEWAVWNGSVGTIQLFLAAGADRYFHRGLLHDAAAQGHSDVVDLLLSLNDGQDGNKYDYFDVNGLGALLEMPILTGQAAMVRKLVDLGARVDVLSSKGMSLLAVAARHGHATVVKILMEAGCGVDLEEAPSTSPIVLAAGSGHLAALEVLMNGRVYAAPEQDRQWNSALRAAVENGHADVVHLLLNMGPDPILISACPPRQALPLEGAEDLVGETPTPAVGMILTATSQGRTDIVQMMMQHLKDDPTAAVENGGEQTTWMHLFAGSGCLDLLHKAISKGWKVDEPVSGMNTPLVCAAERGHGEIVRLLLLHGASPHGKPEPPRQGASSREYALEGAIANGHAEIVEMLLDHGANPNAIGDSGVPVIFSAIPVEPIFRLLLERGADPHSYAQALDGSRQSLLSSEVIRIGTAAETLLLIERGVTFHLPGQMPETSLTQLLARSVDPANLNTLLDHHQFDPQPGGGDEQDALLDACRYGNLTLLQLLIARGFNVCHPEWQADILFTAVSGRENTAAAVDILLKEGVDIDARDKQGKTALTRAFLKLEDCETAVPMLLQRGANLLLVLGKDFTDLVGRNQATRELVLRLIDDRGIFMDAEPYLRHAMRMYMYNDLTLKDLESFYWSHRYPV